jgi:metal-responsive CopG/Arc/MetJ family transcriptional regulator
MREVEHLKKLEYRTRSELVREALRNYFALRAKFREEEPTRR